ncbi:MAG TPA: ribosome maturation factor RimP [Steroidobacteraceae bacterium]|nr:ribosome maturation factor RimP [Steroidobacteraceae bacterium]
MVRDQLEELLAPLVDDLGYRLWELEYAPRSNGALVRLFIDVPEGAAAASSDAATDQGISLADCERVSRAVSERLDAADPIQGHYTLEVSSPGLDRVLRTRAHFARFVGELVRVEMKHLVDGRRRFLGRLREVGERDITLDVDGAAVSLSLAGIHKARVAPWAN